MKKLLVVLLMTAFCSKLSAQSHEVKQLLLNVEKLAQFKKILENMYDGYKVLHEGYTTIKDISQGNFSLHKLFLDRLMEVSPVVRRYKRVADIINGQVRIVTEHRQAFNRFRSSGQFTEKEIEYMGKVYSNLFNESLKNLDELTMVITAGKVRMSDDERLQAIDRIYSSIEDQLGFLREFNSSTYVLVYQREKEQMDVNLVRKMYGLE